MVSTQELAASYRLKKLKVTCASILGVIQVLCNAMEVCGSLQISFMTQSNVTGAMKGGSAAIFRKKHYATPEWPLSYELRVLFPRFSNCSHLDGSDSVGVCVVDFIYVILHSLYRILLRLLISILLFLIFLQLGKYST